MLENILIGVFALMVLSAVLIIGYFIGLSDALSMVEDYSINEVCPHWITKTKTLSVQCGCETTAEFCAVCGEQLTKPKTDC